MQDVLNKYEYFKTDNGILYCGDCLDILPLIGEIDLCVSSPPYFNLRDYFHWDTYNAYLEYIKKWFNLLNEKIKQGRHIAWNIQDNIPEPSKDGGRFQYPFTADTIKIAMETGLRYERNIVWNKNTATQVMFGSYPYPPNIIYSSITENILIFRKPGKTDLSNKSEDSKIDKKDWNLWKNNVWVFAPQTRSEHPAPYPIELPNRIILLHSFINDIVLDPFLGSGTTAVACEKLNRRWIGIEISEKYCQIAKSRIKAEADQIKMFTGNEK